MISKSSSQLTKNRRPLIEPISNSTKMRTRRTSTHWTFRPILAISNAMRPINTSMWSKLKEMLPRNQHPFAKRSNLRTFHRWRCLERIGQSVKRLMSMLYRIQARNNQVKVAWPPPSRSRSPRGSQKGPLKKVQGPQSHLIQRRPLLPQSLHSRSE